MIRHVAGVAEIVDDMERAIAFYRDVLGLDVEEKEGGDYAMVSVPGVLHFGIWNRDHAAECTYGGREHADRIALGFTLEFEVDDVAEAAGKIEEHGWAIAQLPREEPWGQKTLRMLAPSGGILGFAQTPWARCMTTQLSTEGSDAN